MQMLRNLQTTGKPGAMFFPVRRAVRRATHVGLRLRVEAVECSDGSVPCLAKAILPAHG